MPVVGAPRSYENKFTFSVEIDNVKVADFEKCSELKLVVDKVERREGGRLTPRKSPGLANWEDLTLERGAVAQDSDLYDWMQQVVDVAADKGEVDDVYKRNLEIICRDRDRTVIKRWRIDKAWPTEFTGGDWDNSASEHTVEMVVLTFEDARRIV